MPTVHADCQASVDGRDLSRSVTAALPREDRTLRFARIFAHSFGIRFYSPTTFTYFSLVLISSMFYPLFPAS